jgi:hypothetical protein
MDQKLRVTSIVLTTANGMRVELTIPEARDLHEQLAKMFGKNLVNTPLSLSDITGLCRGTRTSQCG